MTLRLVSQKDIIGRKAEKPSFKELRMQKGMPDTIFFTDEVLKEMSEITRRSSKRGREYGASVCVNPGLDTSPIYLKYVHVGERDNVIIMRDKCRRGDTFLGSFHTHPRSKEIIPSLEDLRGLERRVILCIGSREAKPEKIMCFYKKSVSEKDIAERNKILNRLDKIYNILTKGGIVKPPKKHIFRQEFADLSEKLARYYEKIGPKEDLFIDIVIE